MRKKIDVDPSGSNITAEYWIRSLSAVVMLRRPCQHGTTNLLNRLHLPIPSRSTVVKVMGNDVPREVGQI